MAIEFFQLVVSLIRFLVHSLNILELNSSLSLYLCHQHSLSNHVCIVQLAYFLPFPGHLSQPLVSHPAVLRDGFTPLSLRQGLVEDFLKFLHPFHALPQERFIGCGELRILLRDVVALGECHSRQVVGKRGCHGMRSHGTRAKAWTGCYSLQIAQLANGATLFL
jgi:hypothetical protein